MRFDPVVRITVGDLKNDVAGVHVVGRDAAVGRLHQRQSLRTNAPRTAADAGPELGHAAAATPAAAARTCASWRVGSTGAAGTSAAYCGPARDGSPTAASAPGSASGGAGTTATASFTRHRAAGAADERHVR